MGVIQKFTNPAKEEYEKTCAQFTFRTLSNLDKTIVVKGKITDRDKGVIQFSEELFPKKIQITPDLFFTDDKNIAYTINPTSIQVDEITIELSKKNELLKVTNVHFFVKTLTIN